MSTVWSPKFLFLLLFLFSATLLSHGKHIGQGDEPHYLMICHSLFFDHDIALQNNYSEDNLIGDGNLKPEKHLIPGRNGNLYSIHSPGMPFMWTPLFGISYKLSEVFPEDSLYRLRMTRWTFLRLIIALSMLGLTAYLATQIQSYLSRDVKPGFAFLGTAICFLSIPLLPMGFLFFTEIPAAFLSFQSYRLMQDTPSRRYWLSGLASAYLPFLHIKYLLLSVVLFVLLFFRWRKSAVLAVMTVVLLMLLNYHTWESFMPYAAYGKNPLSLKILWEGFLGLFLDQEFGLLWFSPIYLLVPAGFYLTCKRTRNRNIELLAIIGSTVLVSAAYPLWWGGWSPAARFLTPAVIMMVPLVVYALEQLWSSRAGRYIVIIFFIIQLFFAVIFWFRPKLMWNYAYGESNLYNWLIDGYTYSLPSLITISQEDLGPCLFWGAAAFVISLNCVLLIKKQLHAERRDTDCRTPPIEHA